MAHSLCILTLCLTQALWLSSAAMSFSDRQSGSCDAVNAVSEVPAGSVIEAELEECECIGNLPHFDVVLNRDERLQATGGAPPVPSRPVDVRGCRPPPESR